MKVAAIATCICLTCLIIGVGCSKDEPPFYAEREAVVRQPINKPVEMKTEIPPPAQDVTSQPEVKKEEGIIADDIKVSGNDEVFAPVMEEDEGIYVTDKGDSLSSIAGKNDVLGDASKWPVLYRLNKEMFQKLPKDANLPDREIPKGTRLDIITMDEAKETLKNRPKNYWVINVISSPQMNRIVPHVLNLIDNGYPAYITRVKVKGEDWIRIRVGFFGARNDAEKEGEKIMATLKISDIWTTKVGDEERGEFGGY